MPKPFPIMCRVCHCATRAERGTDGISTRKCRNGHKAKYQGKKYLRPISVRRETDAPRCWCGCFTKYIACGREIPIGSEYVRVTKRVCSRGHRSWFRRGSEGGGFVRRIKPRKAPAAS